MSNLDNALRWLRQAERDLDDARFVMTGKRFGLACFLCQQSAEKSVKAFLYASGAESVWGHSVAELLRDAVDFDPSFEEMIPLGARLDKYYIPTRYPDALPGGIPADAYDQLDATRAIETAEAIVSHVKQRIKESR